MELLRGYIYAIRNKKNGMLYVGQTVKTLPQRLNLHFSKYSRCSRLKSSIQHYGKENFEITMVEMVVGKSKEHLRHLLNVREKENIMSHNSIHPFGYNLTAGGDRPKMSEDVVERIAKGHRKPVVCIETGQRWSSVTECASYFKVKPKQISKVLKGQRKRLKWAYTLAYEIQQS